MRTTLHHSEWNDVLARQVGWAWKSTWVRLGVGDQEAGLRSKRIGGLHLRATQVTTHIYQVPSWPWGMCSNSFNPHTALKEGSSIPMNRWSTWASERLRDGSMITQLRWGRAGIQSHCEVNQWVASSHGRALRLHHQLLSATTREILRDCTIRPMAVESLSTLLYLDPCGRSMLPPASVCFSLKSSCFKELEF